MSQVAFDGQSLAASRSAGVVLWDTKTWKEQMLLMNDGQDVWALAFSPNGGLSTDGGQFAFADMSKALHIKRGIMLRFRTP